MDIYINTKGEIIIQHDYNYCYLQHIDSLFSSIFMEQSREDKRSFHIAGKAFLKTAPSLLTILGIVGLILGTLTPRLSPG